MGNLETPESFEPNEVNITSYREDLHFVDLITAAIVSELSPDVEITNEMIQEYVSYAQEIVDYSIKNVTTPYQASKLLGYSPIEPTHQIVVNVAKILFNDYES